MLLPERSRKAVRNFVGGDGDIVSKGEIPPVPPYAHVRY